MSTQSIIIAKTDTGYAGIYCHYDGYFDGVGLTLWKHYRDPATVAALIALGDLSSLGEKVAPDGPHSFDDPQEGVTVAYGRDRGEAETAAFAAPTLAEVEKYFSNAHNGYVYVFDGKDWHMNGAPMLSAVRRHYLSLIAAQRERPADLDDDLWRDLLTGGYIIAAQGTIGLTAIGERAIAA